MQPTERPRIKICCISSVGEAQVAVRHGASALGFVSPMPSGPGVIDDRLIAKIVETVPPGVSTFLLTCRQDSQRIVEQQRVTRASTLQLCDRVDAGAYGLLRKALPGIRIVQVIHVVSSDAVDEARGVAPFVDAILLDSGNPNLAVKELGGTGRTHDWELSRIIRETIDKPLYLAGGLRPENVAEAVQRVRPFGIDVCSGVRTEGRLDETKLSAFFAQAST